MPKHFCRIIMTVVFKVATCKKLFSRVAHRQELALSTRCGRKDCRKQPVLFVIFMRLMHAFRSLKENYQYCTKQNFLKLVK